MKLDEAQFLAALQREGQILGIRPTGRSARDIAQTLGMPEKRARFLCQKWAEKGWYDYGVSVDLGWLLPAGMESTPQ